MSNLIKVTLAHDKYSKVLAEEVTNRFGEPDSNKVTGQRIGDLQYWRAAKELALLMLADEDELFTSSGVKMKEIGRDSEYAYFLLLYVFNGDNLHDSSSYILEPIKKG